MNILEKIKEIFRKSKKALAIGGTVATVGLATGCGTDKEADVIDNSVKVEQAQEKEFKEEYKVPQSELLTLENEIAKLKTSKDVLDYMKNMYIEEYEKITGDTQLTTADIKILESPHDYMFSRDDGTIVTHGSTPDVTKQAIINDGHNYEIIQSNHLRVYTICLKANNEVIDSMTLGKNEENGTTAVRVIPGDKYNEMRDYTSTLAELNQVIPEGFNYMEQLELIETQGKTEFNNNQCKTARDNFITAIKEVQDKQKNKEQSQNSIEGQEIVD